MFLNAPQVQLRLAIQRLKTLQEKKGSVAKAARRDIATLLERGKVETARIKTESIVNEDIHIELLELLELYCEIVFTRFGLIENSNAREPDPGVSEAIIGIVYSAHRTEVKELHFIRESFMHRYGRDWSILVMDNVDDRVSARVLSKVTNETPSPALVDAYIAEIARGYKLDWNPPAPPNLLNPPPSASDIFNWSELSEENGQERSHKSPEVTDEGSASKSAGIPVVPPGPTSMKAVGPARRLSVPTPEPVSTPKSIDPPPYSGVTPGSTKVHRDNDDEDDEDDDDNDDLLRRFQALSNRK